MQSKNVNDCSPEVEHVQVGEAEVQVREAHQADRHREVARSRQRFGEAIRHETTQDATCRHLC